jgi:2-hydroxy-3-keto-5-methylthiopentenyl-1-phosphate phosphatase
MKSQETEQIDSIAVCVVTNNNEDETKFFIENLIQKTSGNFRLYIYDYQSTSKDFLNYLANVALSVEGCFKFIIEDTKLANIYNMFIDEVKEKYIAFVSVNTMLDNNWISELLYHYTNIPNSGCIGIRSQLDDVFLSSMLFQNVNKDEDEMRTVWVKKLNVIDTPIFFEKSKVEVCGIVNDSLENFGYEMNVFSFQFKINGYLNYYVKNTICIKTYFENNFLLPHKTKTGKMEFATQALIKLAKAHQTNY